MLNTYNFKYLSFKYLLTDTRAGVEDAAEDCSDAAANGQSIHFLPRDIWRPWTWYSPFVGRNSWDIDPNNCCRLIVSFCTIFQKHSLKKLCEHIFSFTSPVAVPVTYHFKYLTFKALNICHSTMNKVYWIILTYSTICFVFPLKLNIWST